MIRTGLVIVSATLVAAIFAPPPPFHVSTLSTRFFQGGDLGRRVTGAPDGLVKMTYAARDGICGDGRSFIADATTASRGWDMWFSSGMSMSGTMSDISTRCARGPVRLMLVVRDHRVIDVQPFVGPSSPATERPGTDLGTVSTAAVSRYLLDLAASGRDDNARNALLAASIADSVKLAGPLAAMARNKSLASSVREGALKWASRVAAREGDRDAMRVARTIAEDADDEVAIRERAIRVLGEETDGPAYLRALFTRLQEPTLRERVVRVVGEEGTKADLDWIRGVALNHDERTSIRERAVRVLGESSDSRSLRELYDRLDDPSLRERVIRTMADIGDADSRRWLHEIVERRAESSSIRDRAIRTLADQGDITYLRSAYRTIEDEDLRERILRSVADAGGAETKAWLRSVVRDSKESSGLRDRAVRSLADAGAETSELVSLYDSVSDRQVRDRLVNILADRGDRTAREKLKSIATDDPDEDLRRRATRKLTDK